jgi:hypothetical protein
MRFSLSNRVSARCGTVRIAGRKRDVVDWGSNSDCHDRRQAALLALAESTAGKARQDRLPAMAVEPNDNRHRMFSNGIEPRGSFTGLRAAQMRLRLRCQHLPAGKAAAMAAERRGLLSEGLSLTNARPSAQSENDDLSRRRPPRAHSHCESSIVTPSGPERNTSLRR